MRAIAKFNMSTDWLVKDYRSIFIALLKSTFINYDPMLYTMLYGTDKEKLKVNKPFTFALRFPQFVIEGNKILCGDHFSLTFSTDEQTLITAFYNGLKRKQKIIIGNNSPITFNLEQINLLPLKRIQTNKALFRTISPVLVNKKGNNLNYLSPEEHDFSEAFKFIIAEQARQFQIPCTESKIEFEIHKSKKLPLTHYNQTMTSWLGEFTLEAPLNILQLVYDTGIGVRRSQGFGMLEILKQY